MMLGASKHEQTSPTQNLSADPVPSGPRDHLIDQEECHPTHRIHHIEAAVRDKLLRIPHVRFTNLVVRRVANGVCLQGRMEADDETPDVSLLLRQIEGVNQVFNRLVVEHPHSADEA